MARDRTSYCCALTFTLLVAVSVTATFAQETTPDPGAAGGNPFGDDESSASDVNAQPVPATPSQSQAEVPTLDQFPNITYVVVSSDGRTSLLQGDPLICYYARKLGPRHRLVGTRAILPVLLSDGWSIVRETSMGTKYSGALILLQRQEEVAPAESVGRVAKPSNKLAAAGQ